MEKTETKHCRSPGERKPCIWRSCCRSGMWLFSAQLFSPCGCGTPGSAQPTVSPPHRREACQSRCVPPALLRQKRQEQMARHQPVAPALQDSIKHEPILIDLAPKSQDATADHDPDPVATVACGAAGLHDSLIRFEMFAGLGCSRALPLTLCSRSGEVISWTARPRIR